MKTSEMKTNSKPEGFQNRSCCSRSPLLLVNLWASEPEVQPCSSYHPRFGAMPGRERSEWEAESKKRKNAQRPGRRERRAADLVEQLPRQEVTEPGWDAVRVSPQHQSVLQAFDARCCGTAASWNFESTQEREAHPGRICYNSRRSQSRINWELQAQNEGFTIPEVDQAYVCSLLKAFFASRPGPGDFYASGAKGVPTC